MAKIFAKVETEAEPTDSYGYNVYDWFIRDEYADYLGRHPLDIEFETAEEAQAAAQAAYRGPDVDGVECSWQIA